MISCGYLALFPSLTFLNQANISIVTSFYPRVLHHCPFPLEVFLVLLTENDNVCSIRALLFPFSAKVLMLIWWPYNEFYMYLINRMRVGGTATEAPAVCD